MKLNSLVIVAAVTASLANCARETDKSTQKDIVTDIDGTDEAREAPFIYYIEGEDVVRGECSSDAAFTRAQCQTNMKTMKEEVFSKRVAQDLNKELQRIDSGIETSQKKIDQAKEEANSLLVKNHDLQKKMDEKSVAISENSDKLASKETDLTGLAEQLKATEDALAANPPASEQQQLLAIKTKLNTQIQAAKKDLEALKATDTALNKDLDALKSDFAANSGKVDSLIAVQNEESALIVALQGERSLAETDQSDMENTFKLLKANLIPYEIKAASNDFEKNKRWIKRFDLVMNGQVAGDDIRVGSWAEFSGNATFNSGYIIFKQIIVEKKMDVSKLAVISRASATGAHLALYAASDKKLIVSTPVFSLKVGTNEIETSFTATIEPGTYLLGIQASSSLNIAAGSSGTTNYSVSNIYPQIPSSLSSTPSTTTSSNLNLYMIGSSY